MPRERKLAMTEAEIRAFLAGKSVLILATIDADGVPVGDVARYVFEDDALYFRLPRNEPTHRKLRGAIPQLHRNRVGGSARPRRRGHGSSGRRATLGRHRHPWPCTPHGP